MKVLKALTRVVELIEKLTLVMSELIEVLKSKNIENEKDKI